MNIYTQALEGATVTLSNCGSDSNEKLLFRRDLDLLGLNTPEDVNTKGVLINTLPGLIDIDYVLLGNLTTSDNAQIEIFYYDAEAWQSYDTTSAATYTNENLCITFTKISDEALMKNMDYP